MDGGESMLSQNKAAEVGDKGVSIQGQASGFDVFIAVFDKEQ
jgi:hypothetical protein